MPQSHVDPLRRLGSHIAYGVALLLLFGLCYGGHRDGTYFAQDDYVWLCFSKFYREPHRLLFRNTLAGQFFRPLGQYWWLAVHSFAEDRVTAYQYAVLATHLVNALLAAWLAVQIAGPAVARIVLLLFALNPIFVAPVSNFYHYNFDTLGCACYLTALVLLCRVSRGGTWSAGLLSCVTAVAAYFSKESFFTFPAVALLVIGIGEPGGRWMIGNVRRSMGWLAAHAAVCIAAWGWRWAVIGRFGGYGLAEIHTAADLVQHVIERGSTLAGFTGWSLLPACQRWYGDEFLPLLCSVPLLVWLTWRCRRAPDGPGALWCWSWIVVVWLPSTIMTTYAAVSFYPALFGSTLLLAQALRRWAFGLALAVLIGTYYALHGWAYFHDRVPRMEELRRQLAALRALYPVEVWMSGAHRRVILDNGDPDLFPDAALKYAAPPGTSMTGMLFFNVGAPVNWVVTGKNGPGDIHPLMVSRTFQDGFMEMPPYRAYPLELDPNAVPRNAEFRSLTILHWDGNQFRDITRSPDQANSSRTLPFKRELPVAAAAG